VPSGNLSVDRECRCEAIADDSAADDVTQIINPLGIGTAVTYSPSGEKLYSSTAGETGWKITALFCTKGKWP